MSGFVASMKKRSKDLTRVVILGGGPAGVACALTLDRLAAETGKSVSCTIVEGKQFSGERHYNPCVGVLSPTLTDLLEEDLGVPFPSHLGRTKITGYVLHTPGEEIELSDEIPSIALRRVHFDAYMSAVAKKRGVNWLQARAVDLEFHESHVIVYTESAPIEADVVVGAFGLDEGSATMLARATPYQAPAELSSIVTKCHPGEEAMEAFGSRIHAFLPINPRIEFGGITPKGNHLTFNIAGKSVDTPLMRTFLSQPNIDSMIGLSGFHHSNDLRFFKGRFPSSLAREYYGDRYVVVGDAAGLVRPFKGKGVTSAVLSGIRAARTIMIHGVSKRVFHDHYRPANQDITGDLFYGQTARLITINLARYQLLNPVLRAAATNSDLQSALHGAVSGHMPYKQVFAKTLSPRSLVDIVRALFV
jgi:flavin-dependent dehydrogenase